MQPLSGYWKFLGNLQSSRGKHQLKNSFRFDTFLRVGKYLLQNIAKKQQKIIVCRMIYTYL